MSPWEKLQRLWDRGAWGTYPFRIPRRKLPPVLVRAFRPEDTPACHEIYRLNEPGRFPDGYFAHFSKFLTSGKALFLVVEEDLGVSAFAAVSMHPPPIQSNINLTFGMVHPKEQRRGLGTVMLLARLAVLPDSPRYILSMAPVAPAQRFYRQFGFGLVGTFQDYDIGDTFDTFGVTIRLRDLQNCRKKLQDNGVRLDVPDAVPECPIARMKDGTYRMV